MTAGFGLEGLDNYYIQIYPTIHKLLCILLTLPVSVAMAEPSFSTLPHLKTWLRAKTGEESLTGFALMSIHRELQLDTKAILHRFIKTNRHQEFAFTLT